MSFNARTVTAANGSQTTFPVSFPLSPIGGRTEVAVYVRPATDAHPGTAKVVGTDFNWVSDGQIAFLSGHVPAAGTVVDIRRQTKDNGLDNTVQSGGSLRSSDLVQNDTQLLYLLQEREDEDADLQAQLDTEAAARAAGDATVTALVATEATSRAAGDANLQNQIDHLPIPVNIIVNGAPSTFVKLPVYSLEQFASAKPSGVVGDGTDDGPALLAMSLALSGTGGTGWFPLGVQLWIGTQVLNGMPGVDGGSDPYTWAPVTWVPFLINGATKPVRVFGNGCSIKCLPGKKFGAFDEAGNPIATGANFFGNPGVAGLNRASPYYAMIMVRNCTAPVFVHDFDLDGNVDNLQIGGDWGNTGKQQPATGILVSGNFGHIHLSGINAHHHALDGGGVSCTGRTVIHNSHKELGIIEGCRFEFNRRQGLSHIGGKGWSYRSCAFNYTGKTTRGSDAAASYCSSPGAGFDAESEAGVIEELNFDNCEFIANTGNGLLWVGADIGSMSARMCTFMGTTGYSMWGPTNATFDACKFVGTAVWQGGVNGYNRATALRRDASNFLRCSFLDANSESVTGAVYTTGSFTENVGYGIIYSRCSFIHDRAGFTSPGVSAVDSESGAILEHCEFVVKQGSFGPIGHLVGSGHFKEEGAGFFTSFPTAPHQGSGFGGSGKDFSGVAECPWVYVKADGTVIDCPPTLDASGCYRGTGTVGDGDFTTVNAPSQPADNSAYGLATIRILVPLTANRTVTLSTVNAKHGMRRRFTRAATSTGAFNWVIGALKNLAVGQWCEIEYDGVAAAWKLIQFGSL